MRKCEFSLVELVIVVAILGIMAAIVVPQFQEHSVRARQAASQNNLGILRSAIELYSCRHGGIPPGYQNDDPLTTPTSSSFHEQLVTNCTYLLEIPRNPFNDLQNVQVLGNGETFPKNAVEGFGWIYQPATKTIRLNWSGSDSDGIRYLDY